MPYFFQQAFATAGDKSAIPVAVQPDGSVSYNQGFGFDYSRDKTTDPLAKDVPRESTNQLFFAITENLNTWQLNAAPLFVEAADNGGVPVSYRRGAMVTWRPAPGDPYRTYIARADGVTSTPATAADWQLFAFEFAPNGDTTSTNLLVSPAYVAARLAGLSLTVPAASTTEAGISQYATDAETIAGVIANRTVTVTGLTATATNKGWGRAASTTQSGLVQLADPAVLPISFAATDRAVSPAWVNVAIPPASTTAVGRVALASAAEATAQSVANKAVPPNALTGYARLGENVNFSLAQSAGGFDSTSSRKVKCDLRPNPYGLDDVLRIDTVVGRYRQDYVADSRERVFLVAEQLARVIPEAVNPVGAEYRGERVPTVNYDMLVPVLVKALQEERDRRVAGFIVAGVTSAAALVLAALAFVGV